eukprot:TRINITY_DN51508_c0_g1_i1.p1 TRINITY_DN51508_c0_g1~~TRINITY_DN51508_c0_g1_i1.p1  ORF type:complete len:198 (-),score=64.09 TRINITY_DN51508_c0_g1_i1:128-721(-)
MMLASARQRFDGSTGIELRGRSLSLYGFGAVAQAVNRLALGFGMSTFAYDPYLQDSIIEEAGASPVKSVEELFRAQYVSLHIPLTDATRASISSKLLQQMPEGATLINTARAEVVDEDALLKMLEQRPDFNYLSDVAPGNADEVRRAAGDAFGQRVIITARKMGAQTREANQRSAEAAAKQIVDYFEKGDVRFQVNK